MHRTYGKGRQAVKLEHVDVWVALERMWIYAREYSVTERDSLSHRILSGHETTYVATDALGKRIGSTRITPEDSPVTLVTETYF
ncbi:MAG TPA: hypothetical protein VFE08_14435 [Candidatus Sulfotelmatobacter sp.]|jgi:hypothetical protein|nr:hypothetical protein [Candidatus Sulfotelmatobacter sp.]